MKNLFKSMAFAALIFLITSKAMVGQKGYWSSPVSITDSISDNRNAVIKLINFTQSDFYIFWEKSTDTLSTSICYKRFYSNDAPEILLAETGVHYTNPQLMVANNGTHDTTFYLFYESDATGNQKIYFRAYGSDGFTEPHELTSTTQTQTDLLCNDNGRIVWMEQDRVMHVMINTIDGTFDTPVVLDSANCSFPSIPQPEADWSWGFGFPVVAWIKEVNNSSTIVIRSYDNEQGWLDPLILYSAPQCLNLSFCNGFGSNSILTWDYFNDTICRIATYDLEQSLFYPSAFELSAPAQPKFYSGFFFVKSRYMEVGISSFVYHNMDTAQIYSSPFYYGAYTTLKSYEHISMPENIVTNPQISTGKFETPCNYYFINSWEEKVNNHWQLKYASAFECLSGIEEQEDINGLNVSISPNPFSEETRIFLNTQDAFNRAVISIHNTMGGLVETLYDGPIKAGQHEFSWNGKQQPPGLYLVTYQGKNVLITKKIILTK